WRPNCQSQTLTASFSGSIGPRTLVFRFYRVPLMSSTRLCKNLGTKLRREISGF
ncbi:hypothetical protein K1T71_000844, partial [Dendrolimus kikuchii]